jgi:hypothetical protein
VTEEPYPSDEYQDDFDYDTEEYESLFEPWRDKAKCFKVSSEKPYMMGAWDGPNEDKISHPYSEAAAEICLTCPVRLLCLQGALSNPRAQGIRGGYTFDKGRLPVAQAREIRDTLGLTIGEHQSLGRPKKRNEQG